MLILGAGGATQGIIGPLLEQAPAQIVIANRTQAKAAKLVNQFDGLTQHNTQLTSCDLQDIRVQAQVIINATSLGLQVEMHNEDKTWPALNLEGAFCYDMSYGANAAFQRWCQERDARKSVDGLGMLVEQAAAAFTIWRGQEPNTDAVLVALRQTLS